MALIEPITKLETYKRYMGDIGKVPTYKINHCFACGLPGVWLYMKSIGLEDIYFDILNKIKHKSMLFKELFYLLILTNRHNKFFPKIPESYLKIEIPPAVLEAQLEMPAPEFELAYAFTREQLLDTLQLVALPDKMVLLGDQIKSIAIMFSNNKYCVYHSDNTNALEFKTIDGCVDVIMRVMGTGE